MIDVDTNLNKYLEIEIELELDAADTMTNKKTKFQKLAQAYKNSSNDTKEVIDWGKPVGKEFW